MLANIKCTFRLFKKKGVGYYLMRRNEGVLALALPGRASEICAHAAGTN
jgi:hypothetical protein